MTICRSVRISVRVRVDALPRRVTQRVMESGSTSPKKNEIMRRDSTFSKPDTLVRRKEDSRALIPCHKVDGSWCHKVGIATPMFTTVHCGLSTLQGWRTRAPRRSDAHPSILVMLFLQTKRRLLPFKHPGFRSPNQPQSLLTPRQHQ